MFTDLFVHQTTHMISAMGVRLSGPRGGGRRPLPGVRRPRCAGRDLRCRRLPRRLSAHGDGHDDNSYPIEEVIRGHLGTIKFVQGGFQIINDDPSQQAGKPARLETTVKPDETIPAQIEGYSREEWGNNFDTAALWGHFLNCIRSGKRETLCPPELRAAAFTTVAMGMKSYREGKAFFWDKNERKS